MLVCEAWLTDDPAIRWHIWCQAGSRHIGLRVQISRAPTQSGTLASFLPSAPQPIRALRRTDNDAEAVRVLDEHRTAWLNPPGADAAEFKKRTLTNLYNQRPTWLAHLHAALDRAVWADPDPDAVPDDTILARLLALSFEQAGTPTVTLSQA